MGKSAFRHPVHQVCGGIQTKSRSAEILGSLIAASVITVILQKIITAFCSFCQYSSADSPGAAGQKDAEQYILGAPGRPVAHWFLPFSHPPEMLVKIGSNNSMLQLTENPLGYKRTDSIQLFL